MPSAPDDLSPEVAVRLAGPADREAWDTFVTGSCGGILMQTWGWGELRRRSGWRVLRLTAEGEAGWRAAIQILYRKLLPGGLGWAYAPRGPALASSSDLRAAERLLSRARIELLRRGIPLLRLDPEWDLDAVEATTLRQRLRLRPAHFDIQHRRTWLVDLPSSARAALAALPASTRRNINISARAKVEVSIGRDPRDVARFYQLHLQTVGRQKFQGRPLSYYEAAVEELGAWVFLAALDGEPLAGAVGTACGPRLIYLYGGTSTARPEVRASYALHWTMIQWGIQHGCSEYDMWGVPRNFDRSNPAHGYALFKTRWGGRLASHSGLLVAPMLGPLDTPAHRLEAWMLRRRPLLT
ncbi:MAG: peptidoglycan bridge formation glycyltransferase FemA/FemB family protein [Candidatus Dormibacteraeota bacterium]|nr:peptidoglycan bridge formation glycyltransferase FemA/FemB family protein [Candidatus Dormibacteraeota bacterium]